MTFVVAPCSHAAAVYAVKNWHYSENVPKSKLVKFGVWEDEAFIGAVIYGSGANSALVAPPDIDRVIKSFAIAGVSVLPPAPPASPAPPAPPVYAGL